MRMATGKVVDGKVVVDGAPLAEGAVVTVLVREDGESFDVTPEQEAELLAAIVEAERGETVSASEHLKGLRRNN